MFLHFYHSLFIAPFLVDGGVILSMAKLLRVEVLRLLVSARGSAFSRKYGNTTVFPLDVCGVGARMARNHGNAHTAYPNPDASTWFFFFLFSFWCL